jgi:hypothetical protein
LTHLVTPFDAQRGTHVAAASSNRPIGLVAPENRRRGEGRWTHRARELAVAHKPPPAALIEERARLACCIYRSYIKACSSSSIQRKTSSTVRITACLWHLPGSWLGMRRSSGSTSASSTKSFGCRPWRGNRLYFVAFTDRGNVRRVISLRFAERREVKHYVENYS